MNEASFVADLELFCKHLPTSNLDNLQEWKLKTQEGVKYLEKNMTVHRNTASNEDVSMEESPDILEDPDVVVPADSACQIWNFSILWSDTWKAPVLYFGVEENGTVLTREELFSDAPHISFAEHPVTGSPSLFVHPCTTREQFGTNTWAWMCHALQTIGWTVGAVEFVRIQRLLEQEKKR